MTETYRVLLYSHDFQDPGHVRRNLTIARNLARRLSGTINVDVAGLLVTELAPVSHFPLPEGFDWVTIPSVSKGRDDHRLYSPSDVTGGLIKLRSRLLQAALLGFESDLVIINRHIYGAWSELREPLMWLREQHPIVRVILGLREVLDDPCVTTVEWERLGDPNRLRDLVGEVWVYGNPTVHDPVATGKVPLALANRIRFTGYLASDHRADDHGEPIESKSFMFITAGDGSDGHELLRTTVAIRAPAGYENTAVTRPQLDDANFEVIATWAAFGTQVYRFWLGLGNQIAETAAVISMGGYNTVCEILVIDTPALVMPRETPRPEQLIRAEAPRDVCALDMIRILQVIAETLGAWAVGVVTRRVNRSHISHDGLAVTADFTVDLLSDANPTVQEVMA